MKNGVAIIPDLCNSAKLDPKKFQEDCKFLANTKVRFGDRSRLLQKIPGVHNKYTNPDEFFPNSGKDTDRSLGCSFKAKDQPGIKGEPGDRLSMELDFMGRLIDTCNPGEIPDSSMWSVRGAGTVK